jgi:hypothetical protein
MHMKVRIHAGQVGQMINADVAHVGAAPLPAQRTDSVMVRVLVLAANPVSTPRLRLDEEMRAIDEAIRRAEHRDRFELRQHWAVRVADLASHLQRHQPDIVHVVGHGESSGDLILEDEHGDMRPVPPEHLARIFVLLQARLRCVVFNACHSRAQAEAVGQHIGAVIGMSEPVGDRAAIGFASVFYEALAYGRSVKTAFELALAQARAAGARKQGDPVLIGCADAAGLRFV